MLDLLYCQLGLSLRRLNVLNRLFVILLKFCLGFLQTYQKILTRNKLQQFVALHYVSKNHEEFLQHQLNV